MQHLTTVFKNSLLFQKKPESWDDFFNKTPATTEDVDMPRKQQKP